MYIKIKPLKMPKYFIGEKGSTNAWSRLGGRHAVCNFAGK
jgi:hypothetical protein